MKWENQAANWKKSCVDSFYSEKKKNWEQGKKIDGLFAYFFSQ